MLRPLSRLLTMLALLLMPVGMSGAAATAAAPAAASSEHCADHQKPDGPATGEAPDSQALHCAACSALPATDQLTVDSDLLPHAPPAIGLAEGFAGIEPELATPPPRLS